MNDADSKTLEEIEQRVNLSYATRADGRWLISKVKEQDREIERLRGEEAHQRDCAVRWYSRFREAKAEREKLIGSLEKLSVWGRVAFYPGPNEDPSFQAGYMTAIHDAERQINRKLAEAKGEA